MFDDPRRSTRHSGPDPQRIRQKASSALRDFSDRERGRRSRLAGPRGAMASSTVRIVARVGVSPRFWATCASTSRSRIRAFASLACTKRRCLVFPCRIRKACARRAALGGWVMMAKALRQLALGTARTASARLARGVRGRRRRGPRRLGAHSRVHQRAALPRSRHAHDHRARHGRLEPDASQRTFRLSRRHRQPAHRGPSTRPHG